MKKTGEMLRKAREAKGLSMNEIALSLKINSKILTSIEDGDQTKLPAKTFLRGFVQSYANYLKMNTDEVMAVFAEEMGSTRPKPVLDEEPIAAAPAEPPAKPEASSPAVVPTAAPVATPAKPEPSAKEHLAGLEESSQSKTILFSGVAIVLLVLIFGTVKIIEKYQRESVVPETVEIAAPIVETPVSTDVTAVTTSPPEAPVAATNAVTTPAPAAPATPTPVTPAKNEPAPRSEPPAVADKKPIEPAKPPVEAKKPVEPVAEAKKPEEPKTEEKKPEQAAEAKPAEKKPRSLELIIEAMDQVDIEYSTVTGAVQKIHLGPDQFHTIKSTNGLKLNVSNGGAVNLILNGRDLGAPGDLGKPAKLTY